MSLTTRQRTTVLPFLALLLALGGVTAIISSFAQVARAGVEHNELVPAQVRRDLPVALDGRVMAHAQVGNRIFVGGDFTQVALPDGTILDQAYLYAYDIDTGELDHNFLPTLNNPVDALEASDTGDGVYVGGRFWRWETDAGVAFPLRVAKLDAFGALDTSFAVQASARVITLELVGDDLYLGGDFLEVSGVPIAGLARVDATTGELDTDFDLDLKFSIHGNQLVRRVVAHPSGDELFVLHYNQRVLGELRQGVFKLDISSPEPVLSDWEISLTDQVITSGECWGALRDLAMSPDGSFIVIGGQGADRPPNCDSILRYETSGAGVTNFTWSARMYSSIFSLAVSDVAVYAGGHFCAAPLLGAIYDGGLTSDFGGQANQCFINDPEQENNPSSLDPVNAVFRNQLAALDPDTAQALDWDPGSNNSVGVFDLTLIDRGLLAGHDGDRFSDFLVGRSGFFDFGVPDDVQAPTIAVTNPAAGLMTDSLTAITGEASDNRSVTEVSVRLRSLTTQEWLQQDGTFGPDQVDLDVAITATGIGEVSWSVPVGELPPGDYEVRGFVSDAVGLTSDSLSHPFTVPGVAQCTVALNDSDQPVISYTGFQHNGADTVVVRRNGGFLDETTAGEGAFVDESAIPGDYDYLLRWRPGGVVTDVACTPDSITVPVGGGGVTCTVAVGADNSPIVEWSEIAGVNSYVVREANIGFVATVGAPETSFVDADRAAGEYSYSIRYRQNGTRIDLPCDPSPITVAETAAPENTCTATVNQNGRVVLSWSAIAGEDTYIVRDNDEFVAIAANTLTFVEDDPQPGEHSYVIRSRQAGVTTDVACSPDPLVVP